MPDPALRCHPVGPGEMPGDAKLALGSQEPWNAVQETEQIKLLSKAGRRDSELYKLSILGFLAQQDFCPRGP